MSVTSLDTLSRDRGHLSSAPYCEGRISPSRKYSMQSVPLGRCIQEIKARNEAENPDALRSFHPCPYVKTLELSSLYGQSYVLGYVQDILQRKYGISSRALFAKIWTRALSAHGIFWRNEDVFTPEIRFNIEKALAMSFHYHGPGMDFSKASSSPSQVQEIVHYLLGKGTLSFAWLNLQNLWCIFYKADPELLQQIKTELQQILAYCSDHMPDLGSSEEKIFQAFVGNIIALLPFCYPKEGDTFTIPLKIHGRWMKFDYTVDRIIELSPKTLSSPMFALGLVSPDGPPLLSFIGTTFPGGDGFLATLLADCTPRCSVGKAPYLYGRQSLEEWMRDKDGLQLYGMSLGGALAFHMLLHHKEKIARIDAYSPPGLYPEEWKEEYHEGPEVHIYCQHNDLVPRLGKFPTGDRIFIYHVFLGRNGEAENPLIAHARAYTGGHFVTILQVPSEAENRCLDRMSLTYLHRSLSPVVFFPLQMYQSLAYVLNEVSKRIFSGTSSAMEP
jgi:hypothetical protein